MWIGHAEPGIGCAQGLGWLSRKDLDRVIISPWEVFSLFSFFPVLHLDHPRAVHLVLEGTCGRAAGNPNFASFKSSSQKNGEFDLIAPSGGTGGMGDLMFGLMDTCCRVAVGIWTDVWAFKKLCLISDQLWSEENDATTEHVWVYGERRDCVHDHMRQSSGGGGL